MAFFDHYIFADYSGSEKLSGQREAIALAHYDKATGKLEVNGQLTREILRKKVTEFLICCHLNQQRIIIGFDHQYSFTTGLYEGLTGQKCQIWDQLLELLGEVGFDLPPAGEKPRFWAFKANEVIKNRFGVHSGPFWGPNFQQVHNPRFPFNKTDIKERRIVEQREKKMKTIFQVGGAGSVGLQSIAGIYHLYRLRRECKVNNIPLFCWP